VEAYTLSPRFIWNCFVKKSFRVTTNHAPPPPKKKDINPILFLRRCSFHDVVGTADRNSDVFLLLILVFTRSL
jgi:hypothetical protein